MWMSRAAVSCRVVSGQLSPITKTLILSENDLKSEPNQRVNNRLNRPHHHHRHHVCKKKVSTIGCNPRLECVMENMIL
jgi:hypothetical protein